jgi:hypothetical protein
MKYLILILLPILAVSCESRPINTSQPLQVDVIGTDEAYCMISTKYNRYILNAPDTATIERSAEDLKIDCRGNAGQRRVIVIEPEFDELYYRYPEQITVDFSYVEEGNRFNGYRPEVDEFTPMVKEVLTQDAYVAPIETTQSYPVPKTYNMGRKSYPVPLQ